MINDFGIEIVLEIYDDNGSVVLSARGLRVDFDIRYYQGYNRAKFTIYNLSKETAREVATGDRYIRLFVSQHGGTRYLIADDFYVNNAYTEKRVPDSLTTLYCFDKLKKDVTSKFLNIITSGGSLKSILKTIKDSSEKEVNFKLVDFPKELEDFEPTKKKTIYSGEVGKIIDELAVQYNFIPFIKGNIIELGFQANDNKDNLKNIGRLNRKKIKLNSRDMRSNPVVGMTQIKIDSNLDARIECNSVVDTSDLITSTSGDDIEFLAITKDYLKLSVTGYSLFTVLSVNHVGSSHSNNWSTKVIGIKSTKGTQIKNYNWFK